MNILSSDTTVTGNLQIDISDMDGEEVEVLFNSVIVDEFTATDTYTYPDLGHGNILTIRIQQEPPKTPDQNSDNQIDLYDFFCIRTAMAA